MKMDVKNVNIGMFVTSILLIFHGADGQLICNRGMKSTIQALNSVLFPVTTESCLPSQTCGVATVKVQYQSETGQGKIGGCVSKSDCSSTVGCSVASRVLPRGARFVECKVDCCNTNHCNSLFVSKGSSIANVFQTVVAVVSFQLIMLLCYQ